MTRVKTIALAAAMLVAAGAGAIPATATAARTFGSGGWSWFADPRAIYTDGQTYVGWIDQDRYVNVASVTAGSIERVRIAREHVEDDHGNPALELRPDGRITAYYSDHNGPSMRYRTTSHAGSIESWGAEHKLPDNTSGSHGYTYPNPVYLSAENRTYLFWRGADWSVTYARTGPNGFSHARAMFKRSGQRPYTKVATNGRDEIYLAFTNGHPREVATSIFFATYRAGKLYKASGKLIGTTADLPLRPDRGDHVYMVGQHDGVRAWVHDVAMGLDGRPVIVFATFHDGNRSHRYEYARWNGQRWAIHKITDAGGSITSSPREPEYSGGVVLDHDDPRIVYGSIKAGDHYEIARYVTTDGGVSWQRKWITRDSTTDNVRPVVPRGLPAGKQQVVWMRGDYVFYTDFRTSVVGIARRR